MQHVDAQLPRDIVAVEATVTERWSNGPVEGEGNRLQRLKRQMMGEPPSNSSPA